MMHGQGISHLPNGDKFEGTFINGEQEGKGNYKRVNGDLIEGDFLF